MGAASDVRGMDTNHDGVVDLGEFIAGGGTKEEFDRYDANGDGVLDADELEQRAADKIEGGALQVLRANQDRLEALITLFEARDKERLVALAAQEGEIDRLVNLVATPEVGLSFAAQSHQTAEQPDWASLEL